MLQNCFRMSASWVASLDELGRAHSYHWDQGRFFERFLDTWGYDLSASAINRVLEKNFGASTLCLTHSLLIIFWRIWIITAPGSHVGQHCNTLFCATCSLRRLLIIFIMSKILDYYEYPGVWHTLAQPQWKTIVKILLIMSLIIKHETFFYS